jgi:hypothetical protein
MSYIRSTKSLFGILCVLFSSLSDGLFKMADFFGFFCLQYTALFLVLPVWKRWGEGVGTDRMTALVRPRVEC